MQPVSQLLQALPLLPRKEPVTKQEVRPLFSPVKGIFDELFFLYAACLFQFTPNFFSV